MQILVTVDQAEALRRGIDAPSSTKRIEISPAELDEEERDYLAGILVDGHDATAIRVVEATPQGLRAVIQAELAAAEKAAEEREKELQQWWEQKCADLREILASPPVLSTTFIGLEGEAGYFVSSYRPDRCHVARELPRPRYWSGHGHPTEEGAQYDEYCEQIMAERQRIIEACRPELERLQVEREAQEAAKQAAYDALYARLPADMRERYENGYLLRETVEAAMRKLARDDAGYPAARIQWDDGVALRELSAAEYYALNEIRDSAPDGAGVEPQKVWDVVWDVADQLDPEDYSADEVDSDGEVCRTRNHQRVAVIEWSVGGLQVVAAVPMGVGDE